jgi:hypothetical protein
VALKHTMKNKLERMHKEEVAAKFEALSRHLFGGLRKTTRASGRIRCVLLEIRTGHLPNEIQKSYPLSQISYYYELQFRNEDNNDSMATARNGVTVQLFV